MTYTAVQVQTKTARIDIRVEQDLLDRVDERRAELGQSRTVFIERALEKALGDPPAVPRDSSQAQSPASSRASEENPFSAVKRAEREVVAKSVPEPDPDRRRPIARKKAAKAPAGGLPSIAPRHWS